MAPQATRRTGSSRRAQYSNFFGYIAGAAGALVGGVVLLFAVADPARFSGLRGLAADAATPASSVAAKSRAEGQGFFQAIAGYFAAGHQNARLRREAEITRVRLVEAAALAEENRRLKALLDLAKEDPKPVATARMIGSTASSTRRFATISVGSNSGVTVGMPVRSPLGLVGRVLETGRYSSRVLLVTDTESVVPVRRARDGVAAFATGRGDGTLQLRLINLGVNPLKPGDTFVTSGSGGLYRPGTPIAVVQKLLTDGAIARVLTDPAATEFVAVEQVWALPEVNPTLPAAAAEGSAP
jgi:rod shape-determining protein MreC